MAHHSLRNHHKLHSLANSLRISPAHAAGNLEFLWWSVYVQSDIGPGGRLPTSWTAEVIAHNAGWTGKSPAALVKALKTAGLLDCAADGTLSVHDLYEWAPDYVRRRWRRQGYYQTDNGDWQRDDRTAHGHDRTLAGHDRSCLDHDTRPDPTKRNDIKPDPIDSLKIPEGTGNPRQTRAGPEVNSGNFVGSDRAQRDKFRNLFAAEVCVALGLNGESALRQRRPLYAVARRIFDRGDRDVLATRLIGLAAEKRDAGLDKPVAAWQKAVNEILEH